MSFKNLDQGQDSFLDIIANLVGVLIIHTESYFT